MSRKDYELIAGAIAQARQASSITRNEKTKTAALAGINLAAIGLASHLKQDNPRFDRERFLSACGPF